MDSLSRALRSTALFAGFDDTHIAEISKMASLHYAEEGEVIFRAGEACGAIYCLIDGLVKLFVTGPRKQEKVIEFIGPGQTFAEAAMFSGQGYPVTAAVLEESRFYAIDAFALIRYLKKHPELTWKMMAVMSARLHQLIGQVHSMCLHSAEQKVASFLLEQSDLEQESAPVENLPKKRSDIASALDMTPETLCRIITRFRENGWVSTESRSMFVTHPVALQGLLTGAQSEKGSSRKSLEKSIA